MKPAKHNKFSFTGNLLLCLIVLILASCILSTDREYVSAQVVNETNEDIRVGTGVIFVNVDIMKGQTLTFPVVKDARVSARGKTTGTNYGSHTFIRDLETWLVR